MTRVRIEIKKAGLRDLPLLMEWRMRVLREVFAGCRGVDWDLLRAQNLEYYTEHLAEDTHTALFALREPGEVIGCGGVCYQAEMPSPDNLTGVCGYLMNIYAVPEVRGHGVGRKIVEALIADAKARGTGKIYLESSDVAKDLYREIGFRPMDGYYKLSKIRPLRREPFL